MTTRNRREREKARRINEILDAALEVFSRKGFYDARMEDIAEAAELGKGTLYYYFKTKEELYLGLLRREEEKLTGELRKLEFQDDNIESLILKIVDFFLEYFARNEEYISILFPLQSGFISFKDTALVQELEKLKSEFKHIKFVKDSIEQVMKRQRCNAGALSSEEIVFFLGILIRGIGDFIKMGEREKTRTSTLKVLKRLKLCEE